MNFAPPTAHWLEANQSALAAEIGEVRSFLSAHAGHPLQDARPAHPNVLTALDSATERLGLSPFERRIVIMCAAVELDGSFAALCALAQGDASRAFPTFGLALAALPEAHWSALAPTAPLRRFGLIELQRGGSLTSAPLRIDEAFLHDLTGVSEFDLRLVALAAPLEPPLRLVASQECVVEEIAGILGRITKGQVAPCVQLVGNDKQGKQEVAAASFAALNLCAYSLDASSLVGQPDDIEAKARAWEREARLRCAGLYIDAHELPEPSGRDGLVRFLERFPTPVVVAARQPLRLGRRLTHIFDVAKPTRLEQRDLWMDALASAASERPNSEIVTLRQAAQRVSTQFDFDAAAIKATVQRACADPGSIGERLWSAARSASQNELSEIAQRLDDRPTWDDLVLPDDQSDVLRDIVAHARNRSVVHDDWGMAERHGRGLGLGALFHGPSGTGKTLAAEVIGTELNLDVYRVDLSQLVSKFVGETEKNLRRVFDAAEGGGAILLFDECDAIFGKRGEVERGQDRYANLEVSYLLQRMESYRGIAILTTNLRSAIDPAFMRRLRFSVSFPFPAYEQRVAIWKRALSPGVPVEGIDFQRLARLNVAGGSIRNIAMHAAFLAADALGPVTMTCLRRAALAECGKLERAPSDVEIGGWA
ncbi:MAG: ATP-binding protein [Steroidobacteraceae bacterium]